MSNTSKASLVIASCFFIFLLLQAFGLMSLDTLALCYAIFISAGAIILALTKDDNKDDNK